MSTNIESHLNENRLFEPPASFAAGARIDSLDNYRELYRESMESPETFWGREAGELSWTQPWTQLLDWSRPPFARWFVGGKTNISQNCLDRHLEGPRRDKVAIIWEGEPGDTRTLTYAQLHAEVCQFANALKNNNIGKGDRVVIYMPMVPEAVIAMQGCARIGAVHSVVFGGFSATALRDRIGDAGAKMVITADGGHRGGKIVELKSATDEALSSGCETIEKVIVLKRADCGVPMQDGRDVWWADAIDGQADECEPSETGGCRASTVPVVHVRFDRQAERRAALLGRLPAQREAHQQVGI